MNGRLAFLAIGLAISVALAWLWPRIIEPPNRQAIAKSLLDDGRPRDAVLLFEDETWRGVAEYHAGRYRRAVTEFSSADTALQHYNLGTAYAQLGEWGDAINAYQRVLRLDPAHEDARHNLEIVLLAANMGQTAAAPPDIELSPRDSKGGVGGDETESVGESQEQPPSQTSAENQESEDSGDETASGGNAPGNVGGGEVADSSESMKISAQPDNATGDETPDGGGSVDLLARESTQAAEILLRLITDDPEKVLRVRLYTEHHNREGQTP